MIIKLSLLYLINKQLLISYAQLCGYSLLLVGFLKLWTVGASHWGGFSYCRAQALEGGLSSCGRWV